MSEVRWTGRDIQEINVALTDGDLGAIWKAIGDVVVRHEERARKQALEAAVEGNHLISRVEDEMLKEALDKASGPRHREVD